MRVLQFGWDGCCCSARCGRRVRSWPPGVSSSSTSVESWQYGGGDESVCEGSKAYSLSMAMQDINTMRFDFQIGGLEGSRYDSTDQAAVKMNPKDGDRASIRGE